MDTLRMNEMPEQSTPVLKEVFDFLTSFLPYAAVVTIFWRGIDKIFEYANNGRDARTKELIGAANEPLKEDITRLTESIYQLRDEIKKMK